MKIYVAGAPKGRGWHGSRYARTIGDIFSSADLIFFPPEQILGRPTDIYSEVSNKIKMSDGGITFLSARSSGPLIEAGMLAALEKPQAIIGSETIFGSRLIQGLPHVVGFARSNHEYEVRIVLGNLRDRLSQGQHKF